jgi:molybdopterin/thiamine biosynthesis adenylyltransferase/proteasome lid subunit RPN8/RPN11
MNAFVAITDDVLAEINEKVASHPPERGGALLGPTGQPIISTFLFDPAGFTTGVQYNASPELASLIEQIEGGTSSMELKGILHSHPNNMPQPSSQDHVAYADSLLKAPWLGRFIAPIVTSGREVTGDHRIQLPSGVMSVYIAEARRGGSVGVEAARPHVIPIVNHLKRAAKALGGTPSALSVVNIGGENLVAGTISCRDLDIQVIVGPNYPFTPPTVLVVPLSDAPSHLQLGLPWDQGGQIRTAAMPIAWSLDEQDDDRLVAALLHTKGKGGKIIEVPTIPDVNVEEMVTRVKDLLSPTLGTRSTLVVGAGSVGSQIAESLVRSGVGHLVLVDPDAVEVANLSRSVYVAADVSTNKAEALCRRLVAINPSVAAVPVASKLQDLDARRLDELVGSSDLVVAATDDSRAQGILNHHAFNRRVPAIYPAVYARGRAGEVVFCVPGVNSCYQCATSVRHQGGDVARQTDYGTGRLKAEPALGSDIQHVTTVASKLALGLLGLTDGAPDSDLQQMLIGALTQRFSMVMVSTVPNFDFFPSLFCDTPGQWGYQSAWLTAELDPSCPVCGDSPVDPMAVALSGAPDLTRLVPIDPVSPDFGSDQVVGDARPAKTDDKVVLFDAAPHSPTTKYRFRRSRQNLRPARFSMTRQQRHSSTTANEPDTEPGADRAE